MSKENKDATPLKEFNILDTPFGDGLEMEFTDDFKEDVSVKNNMVEGEDPDTEEFNEFSSNEETVKPKKEVPTKKVEAELEEEVEELSKKEVQQSSDEASSLKVFASWLGEQGLVDFNEESFEDSEEGLKNLVGATIEREVQNYKNSLPEDVHKLVEFVEAGGNPKDFMEAYYNNKSWGEYEVDSEVSQKVVLREYLKAQGEEDEDIEETLDTYEVSGILEKKAKVALNKLQAYERSYQEQ